MKARTYNCQCNHRVFLGINGDSKCPYCGTKRSQMLVAAARKANEETAMLIRSVLYGTRGTRAKEFN